MAYSAMDIDQALLRAFVGPLEKASEQLQELLEIKIQTHVLTPESKSNRLYAYMLSNQSWFVLHYCYEFGWHVALLEIDPVEKTWTIVRDAVRILCRDPDGLLWDISDARDNLAMELETSQIPAFQDLRPQPDAEMPLPRWLTGEAILAARG